MARRDDSESSNWGDFLDLALDFVPDEAGLVILASTGAVWLLMAFVWAGSRLWERISGS